MFITNNKVMEYTKTIQSMDTQTLIEERTSLLNRQDNILNEMNIRKDNHSRTKLLKELEEIEERVYIIMTF